MSKTFVPGTKAAKMLNTAPLTLSDVGLVASLLSSLAYPFAVPDITLKITIPPIDIEYYGYNDILYYHT